MLLLLFLKFLYFDQSVGVGVPIEKTPQSPSLVLVKTRNDMNNASCHSDIIALINSNRFSIGQNPVT